MPSRKLLTKLFSCLTQNKQTLISPFEAVFYKILMIKNTDSCFLSLLVVSSLSLVRLLIHAIETKSRTLNVILLSKMNLSIV